MTSSQVHGAMTTQNEHNARRNDMAISSAGSVTPTRVPTTVHVPAQPCNLNTSPVPIPSDGETDAQDVVDPGGGVVGDVDRSRRHDGSTSTGSPRSLVYQNLVAHTMGDYYVYQVNLLPMYNDDNTFYQ